MHFLSQADKLLDSAQAQKCEYVLGIFTCCFYFCCVLACAKTAEKSSFWRVVVLYPASQTTFRLLCCSHSSQVSSMQSSRESANSPHASLLCPTPALLRSRSLSSPLGACALIASIALLVAAASCRVACGQHNHCDRRAAILRLWQSSNFGWRWRDRSELTSTRCLLELR